MGNLASAVPSQPHLALQGERLRRAGHEYASLLGRLDEPTAVARLQHHALAHVGLRRHVMVDPDWPNASDLDAALERVVATAAMLAGLRE